MKKHLLFLSMAVMAMTLNAQVETEVVTGAGYPDEVYYSLENGIVATVPRATWDLGFTAQFSVSLLANHASGVEVYTYTLGDTTDWATLDTTGMTWVPLYNSIETWDQGAFNAHSYGDLDYGWGVYNMITHMITGDSLYVVKTLSGVYKKVWIVERNPFNNSWTFIVAGLDGSNEQTVELNAGEYADKGIVYYSLDNMEIVDREPAIETWDMMFTRYYDYTIPYMVSGVLTHDWLKYYDQTKDIAYWYVKTQEVREEGIDQATYVDYVDTAFSTVISIVGSDWKTFNMSTFSYDVDSTVVYFFKKYSDWDSDSKIWNDSTYYKLYFTAFDYTAGTYVFVQEKLSAVSSRTQEVNMLLNVYPNPASDRLNLVYDHVGELELTVFDATGRVVLSSSHTGAGFSQVALDISSLEHGIFFLRVKAGDSSNVLRFIKQ